MIGLLLDAITVKIVVAKPFGINLRCQSNLARHEQKEEKNMKIKIDCLHADTCLPDYWSGHHLAHISVPVYHGIHMSELKALLHNELNEGAVAGSDDRTRDDSGVIGEAWYKAAHKAVDAIRHAKKGCRKLFTELEKDADENEYCDSVYAYFVFADA